MQWQAAAVTTGGEGAAVWASSHCSGGELSDGGSDCTVAKDQQQGVATKPLAAAMATIIRKGH